MYPYLAYLFLFQAPAQPAAFALKEDCSDSAVVLTRLAANAPVEVRSAVAGYEKTCYAVTATVDGKPVRGYVLGTDLTAVAEFQHQREAFAASIVNVPASVAPPAAPEPAPSAPSKAAATPAIPAEPSRYPLFEDFSAKDSKGKPVSVHAMTGKVNLICFWSPSKDTHEFLVVNRLYSQFKQQGLEVIAISLSADRDDGKNSLEGFRFGFSDVVDAYAIAAKHKLNYDNVPRTFILNEKHEVIASGLHNQALEALVKKLIEAQ